MVGGGGGWHCPEGWGRVVYLVMPPLSDIEIHRALAALPGWSRRGEALVKAYHFANFPAGIAFLGRVAEVAEQLQHHPDVDIRYTKVQFALTTHDAGGITPQDFVLARAIEELAAA
jgi:4a-hydroxytetrahydrobiopterin dehydratase